MIAVLALGGFAFFRCRSDDVRGKLSDVQRRSAIAGNLIIGVILPLASSFLVVNLVSGSKAFFLRIPEDSRSTWMVVIGTLTTIVGLPFVLRALRLERDASSAGVIGLLMSGYGTVLWIVVYGLLMMTFARGCC